MADEIIHLVSERAIHRLACDYAHGIDMRDLDRFMGIWHDDAVYELVDLGHRTRLVGVGAIKDFIVDRVWPSLSWCLHGVDTFAVDIIGDRATAVSNGTFFGIAEQGGQLPDGAKFGKYSDVFERRNGIWRFSSRAASWR